MYIPEKKWSVRMILPHGAAKQPYALFLRNEK